MTESQPSDVVAEQHVRELSEQITAPRPRECLQCYLLRLVGEFGCDGTLRWSEHWRDSQPRPSRRLLKRLERQGGFCDCEVIMNVYQLYPEDDERFDELPCPHSS
jgi:hypothetical protein